MSQPRLNDARRILVEAEQELGKYERALQNTVAQCEAQRAELERLKTECSQMRAHATEDAQHIRASARADADRLAKDTKDGLAAAIRQKAQNVQQAEDILREAQERAEMALEKNTQEMVDLVSGVAFLRQEIDRLAGEKALLENDVACLADKRDKLEQALEVIGDKFQAVNNAVKR